MHCSIQEVRAEFLSVEIEMDEGCSAQGKQDRLVIDLTGCTGNGRWESKQGIWESGSGGHQETVCELAGLEKGLTQRKAEI